MKNNELIPRTYNNKFYNNHTHHLCDLLHEFGAWIAEEDTLEFTIPNE